MTGSEAALGFFFFGSVAYVLRPLAGALAKRISGEAAQARVPQTDEAVLTELQHLREDMDQLAERVDFAERLLAQQRDASRIAGGSERGLST